MECCTHLLIWCWLTLGGVNDVGLCWAMPSRVLPVVALVKVATAPTCVHWCPPSMPVSPVLALLANTSSTLLHHNKILTLCPDSESDTWGHVQWLPDTLTVWPRWAPDHDTAHGHTSDQCQYWHRLTWSNEATSNFYQMCSLTKQKRFPQQKWAMEYFLTTHCLLGEEWRERIQTMLPGYITLINLGCNFAGAMPSNEIASDLQQLLWPSFTELSWGLERSGKLINGLSWHSLISGCIMHLTNTAAPFKIGLELFMKRQGL